MNHITHKILLLLILVTVGLSAKAQRLTNDFENQYSWYPPWLNLKIITDSTALEGNYVCQCDSLHEYGLGFINETGKLYPRQNINLQYEFLFRSDCEKTQAMTVFSIDDDNGNRYWRSYPLADFVNDTARWSKATFNLNFPFDYIDEGKIRTYVWNLGKENLYFDNAAIEIKKAVIPSYQPEGYFSEQIFTPYIEYIDAKGDTLNDPSIAKTNINIELLWNADSKIGFRVKTEARFLEDVRLLRLALLMPLPEGNLLVYRRNQHLDTAYFQTSYYLDREGFTIKTDSFALSTYHNTAISSLQLNTENRTACFNIDYWRDHPLIHYPMMIDTSDYIEDISYRNVKAGEVLKGEFTFYNSPMSDLPRIMPVWDGYQSAFIFTEHADWTDLRTHRAVLFGNEHITQPEEAVGGFVYYGIPVTKSVFYWNPDMVTNEEISKGLFTGLHATIKTDQEYCKLLEAIKEQGFEICLHTPEQYTTIPKAFPKAMRFMRRHFGTVSWIDHGYNNSPVNNRENLVCDGLLPDSPQYAAKLWKKNGVRYLWNAYYEENRMEPYYFDNHFIQPYDGFGDALPNRQITTLPDGDKDFRLWSTPSTLEVNQDKEWYFYFDSIRLQHLADYHHVFITHIYPAWTNPKRAFWQYDENGDAEAMPGFNFALSQLAHFRDEKKILPTTIQEYLSYYEKLLNVEYIILNDNSIALTNRGEDIKGLTLLCTRPLIAEGKTIDFRETEEGYLVWFNLNNNETVILKYSE